jgi:hypothetical protein
VAVALSVATAVAGVAGPQPASAEVLPGAFGFDTCAAPSLDTMQAWWLDSPYQFVGIYIGGAGRGCAQPNLTPGWVSQASAMGWRFEPIYFGGQSPCVNDSSLRPFAMSNDSSRTAQQAIEEATLAAHEMEGLGFAPWAGNPIYKDLESYSGGQECVDATIAYTNWWTATLRGLGYLAGIYGSGSSMMRDLADRAADPNSLMPDAIFCGSWDQVADTSCPNVDDGYWVFHQRGKQYRGDHNETHGGVTIDIDTDYIDGPLANPGG